MTDTEQTPATAPSSAEPDLMALALAADRGETLPDTPAPIETEQTPTPPAAGTTDKAADTAETAQPEAKPETDTTTPPAKPESAFEKAKKEKARREVTWEKINLEKNELAAQRAKLQRDAEELARMAQTVRTPPAQQTQASPYSAEQYEQAAERFDAKGEFDLADAARAEAKRQRAQPPAAVASPQAPQQQAQPAPMVPGSPQFIGIWRQALTELTAIDPDIARPDSAIYKATAEALRKDPTLNQRPNGIAYAYQRAIKAVAVSAADELTKAKAELERLNKYSALRGSPPGAVSTTPRSIDQMTPAEADAHVLAMAQAADRGE